MLGPDQVLARLLIDIGILIATAQLLSASRSARSSPRCRQAPSSPWRSTPPTARSPAPRSPRLAFVLFLATAMAVTAFPVLVAIVDERGIRDSPLGRLAVGSAAVQDAVGWILLAIALAVFSGGSGPLRIVAEAVGFLVALGLSRPLLRAVLDNSRLGGAGGEIGTLAIALGFAAACAGATQAIGLHLVVGAFAAGVAFPRDLGPPARGTAVVGAVMPITMALLMPIYFLGPGLGVDVGAIGPGGFVELAAIFVVACASKLAGGTLGARHAGLPWSEARVLGVLLNTRGLMELVVPTVGFSEGVLDRPRFSELVILALATTMMTGPLLDLLKRRGAGAAGEAPAVAVPS